MLLVPGVQGKFMNNQSASPTQENRKSVMHKSGNDSTLSKGKSYLNKSEH